MIIPAVSAIFLAGAQSASPHMMIAAPSLAGPAAVESQAAGPPQEATLTAITVAGRSQQLAGPSETRSDLGEGQHESIVKARSVEPISNCVSTTQAVCLACKPATNTAGQVIIECLPATPLALRTVCAICAPMAPASGQPVLVDTSFTFPTPTEPAKLAPTPDPPPEVGPSNQDQSDIIVQARRRSADDPMEKLNVQAFAVTEAVDRAVLGPVSIAYAHTVPEPIQNGISNFLSNLREPVIFLNFLIQLKPGKAAETVGRFAINSTLGGAGLFDIAKRRPFKLPHRPNGFADSLGYYGVKPGSYMFLPLMGPTTPRDLIGFVLDRLVLPSSIGRPFNRLAFTVPTSVVNALDRRATFDEEMQKARASGDAYAARRDFYLRTRKAEIDGLRAPRRHPKSGLDPKASPARAQHP